MKINPAHSRSHSQQVCAQALLRGDVAAHRLARVLRGAAAVTACRRHDAHTHQSTTMRCSVQRSDRATMDRRSSRVPCSTPPRVPSSASCSLAHGWATGQATVRTIGVARVPSASLGGAIPSVKTTRRLPWLCRAVRRQLCSALMPLAWGHWHLLPRTSKPSSQPQRTRGGTPDGAAAMCKRSPEDRAAAACWHAGHCGAGCGVHLLQAWSFL